MFCEFGRLDVAVDLMILLILCFPWFDRFALLKLIDCLSLCLGFGGVLGYLDLGN